MNENEDLTKENEDLIKEIEKYRAKKQVTHDIGIWFFGVLCGAFLMVSISEIPKWM